LASAMVIHPDKAAPASTANAVRLDIVISQPHHSPTGRHIAGNTRIPA
jgi:hypothetical protein